MFSLSLLLLLSLTFVTSVPLSHDYSHDVHGRLPSTWYHSDDHPVHALFKRAPGDGTNYANVGSPAWSSGFPSGVPNQSQLPKAWVDALNAAVAAGKIPNIPVSSNKPNSNPVYPQGFDPNSQQVCSSTYKCRIPGSIWDAPAGVFASAFDDGPLPPTTNLVQFLQQQNQSTTHFMIGVNIIYYPTEFQAAFNAGHDIAVHTWTHPYMTTLSNLDVLGQLGWTAELIRNSTGGRVPKFWRPPYGDSDTRVSAIAKEVFDLTTIVWNQDSADWSLTLPGGSTSAQVNTSLQHFITGPKSPGLMILEHELSSQSVQAFIDVYQLIKSNNWIIASVATTVNGSDAYQNSHNSSSNVTPAAGIFAGQASTTSTSSSTMQSTGSTSGSSSVSSKSASSTTAPAKSSNSCHEDKAPLNMIYAILTIITSTAMFALVF